MSVRHFDEGLDFPYICNYDQDPCTMTKRISLLFRRRQVGRLEARGPIKITIK